jgi:hypothetical protein
VEELASAHLKMRRAYEHLNVLKGELGTFTQSDPVTLTPQRNGDRTEEWWIVKVLEPIPDTIPVLVGDCVHAIRCALDHLVWALANLKAPPHRGTAFPICARREKFYERVKADPANPTALRPFSPGSGMARISGLRPAAKAFIESRQPYHGDSRTLLNSLTILENQDKHRALNLTYMIPKHWENADPPGVQLKILRYALVDGAPFARATYPRDRTEMDVNLHLAADIGFPLTSGGAIEAEELLKQLWWHVQGVMRESLPFFGTLPPDDPIAALLAEHTYWEMLQAPP